MKGILKSIEKKEFKTREGRKFEKVVITCDVMLGNKANDVRTYNGSLGIDYAKKYFEFAGVKSKELVGKEVGIVLAKRAYQDSEGNNKTYEYIKYINILDAQGNAIVMPSEKTNSSLDF